MEILRASHLCKTYGKGENELLMMSLFRLKRESLLQLLVHLVLESLR